MDATVLTDFAPLAAEGVTIRLLSDSFTTKATALQPATGRWAQQYGAARPVQARLTAPRKLHDRLIVIDSTRVWSLTQSLKDFAGRSHAGINRVDGDAGKLKIDAYGQIWDDATQI